MALSSDVEEVDCFPVFFLGWNAPSFHFAKTENRNEIEDEMGHSRPLFSLFSSVQYSWQMFKKFVDDWIWTADLWCWKQPLYQLSHNHCPLKLKFYYWLVELELKTIFCTLKNDFYWTKKLRALFKIPFGSRKSFWSLNCPEFLTQICSVILERRWLC